MSTGKDDPATVPPQPRPAAGEDDERTRFVISPTPPVSAPPSSDEDDDRTQFVPMAPPSPPGTTRAPQEDERTMFAAPAPEPADDTDTGISAPPPLAQPRSAAILPPPANVTVGTLINNNYQVTQVLKSGGMGEVYRGVEIGTGDPVAIKAILPELAEDEKVGLMFKREARTLRQLADEAIVRYYNYLHDRELNRYFLVMEFIEGVPLSDHIATQGAITPAAGRTLLKRLAKGLAKAHAQDVVHRDLSPDNVMLPDGIIAEARLIDFGIAKSNVVKESTMAGQFAGKFKYVAPEQLGHYDGHIGPATDIYGLALLMCAALVGRPLDMGSSIVEAVQSRMSIPDLSEVPVDLRPILAHMLEPDPARRPASMDEVQRLLERPELIPFQYRDGLPMPPAMEPTQRGSATPQTLRPAYQPTPGLQVPGSVAPATTMRGSIPPVAPPAPDERDSGGSRLLAVMAAVFVAILGGAGWYAWSEGLIGGTGGTERPGATAGTASRDPGTAGLPPVQITTREGFLATFEPSACNYAARVSSGANAGMVEGFSAIGGGFDTLPAAYEAAFGARPTVLPRQVTTAQCAALEFARALQGRAATPVQMLMSADTVASGETLSAAITAPEGAAVWTVLISPVGAVYNLTGRLSEPVAGQQTLSFGLNLTTGTEPTPQLLLTVAADGPLSRAATMRDGSQASELLPAVLEEITGQGGDTSAALGWVLLTPPAPEPEPEPEASSDQEAAPAQE